MQRCNINSMSIIIIIMSISNVSIICNIIIYALHDFLVDICYGYRTTKMQFSRGVSGCNSLSSGLY